MRKIALQHNKQ